MGELCLGRLQPSMLEERFAASTSFVSRDLSVFDDGIFEWASPEVEAMLRSGGDLPQEVLREGERYGASYCMVRWIYDVDGGTSLRELLHRVWRDRPDTRDEVERVVREVRGAARPRAGVCRKAARKGWGSARSVATPRLWEPNPFEQGPDRIFRRQYARGKWLPPVGQDVEWVFVADATVAADTAVGCCNGRGLGLPRILSRRSAPVCSQFCEKLTPSWLGGSVGGFGRQQRCTRATGSRAVEHEAAGTVGTRNPLSDWTLRARPPR